MNPSNSLRILAIHGSQQIFPAIRFRVNLSAKVGPDWLCQFFRRSVFAPWRSV